MLEDWEHILIFSDIFPQVRFSILLHPHTHQHFCSEKNLFIC